MSETAKIDITSGIPSEVYVGIGRDHYEGEYALYECARDSAMSVRRDLEPIIERQQRLIDQLCKTLEDARNELLEYAHEENTATLKCIEAIDAQLARAKSKRGDE